MIITVTIIYSFKGVFKGVSTWQHVMLHEGSRNPLNYQAHWKIMIYNFFKNILYFLLFYQLGLAFHQLGLN